MNQMRNFKNYRYIIKNSEMPHFVAFCQNWQDVLTVAGIPRSGLYLILKGLNPPKYHKWSITRTNLPKMAL
jgi:hypothetical protein